jgi:hypothetical protein
MALHLLIPIYPTPNSSSSESESEYEVEVDSERESKWSAAEKVVSSEIVDPGIPSIMVSEHRDGENEVSNFRATPCTRGRPCH